MASLTNTKIKNTYVSLLKVADNGQLDAALQDITDGAGNVTGVQLNTGGDLAASGTVSFGSLKDTGENITISKFVDAADGIGSNNNDTTIPTSAAVVSYVASQVTLEDLDFTGDSGTGAVDLDSQTLNIVGTANEITTVAGAQTLTIGLPSTINVNVQGDLTGNVTATSVLVDGVTATTQSIGDNSTKVATTAYVDAAITAEGLDFAGDAGTGTIDLDSETLTIAGTANEIETSASGNTLTVGLPSDVTIGNDLTVTNDLAVDTDTLFVDASADRVGINKNNPAVALDVAGDITSSGTITATTFSGDLTGNVTGTLAGTVTGDLIGDLTGSVLTAVQTNITSVGTLSSLAVSNDSLFGGISITGANAPSLSIRDTSDAAQSYIIANNGGRLILSADDANAVAGSSIEFKVDGSERLRIDSSGNVGIGISNPATKIHADGALRLQSTAPTIQLYETDRTDESWAFIASSGVLSVRTANNDFSSYDTKMVIDQSGNVGIGTSSPTEKLTVQGKGFFGSDGAGNYSLAISNNDQSNARIRMINTGSGGQTFDLIAGRDGVSNSGFSIHDVTNAATRLRIDSSGNVGIGESTPLVPLHISKDTASGENIALILDNNDSTANAEVGLLFRAATGGQNTDFQIATINKSANAADLVFRSDGSTERMRILSTGGITFNGDTAAANALDDYEEGTFTVTNNGDATGVLDAAATSGQYTKIGKVVYFRIVARASSNFTGTAIGGLPFTVGGSSLSTLFGVFNVSNTSESDLTAIPRRNETALQFYQSNLVASGIPLTTTINTIRVAGWYFVD